MGLWVFIFFLDFLIFLGYKVYSERLFDRDFTLFGCKAMEDFSNYLVLVVLVISYVLSDT